jgi:hypothetical protein
MLCGQLSRSIRLYYECLAQYHERGRLENAQITSRTVVIISTGGIANEADGVEPHDAPNRAGRLSKDMRAIQAAPLGGLGSTCTSEDEACSAR